MPLTRKNPNDWLLALAQGCQPRLGAVLQAGKRGTLRPILRSGFIHGKTGRYVLGVCLCVLAACLLGGFLLDARSMGVNLLAGVACTALGIPIAIWVVDRYLKHVARIRWARVDTLTYRAIAAHLCDSLAQLWVDTPALSKAGPIFSILEGRDKPEQKAVGGMLELARLLRAMPGQGNNDLSDDAIKFYRKNRWDLEQLCESLLARVIEYSDEQDLINALTELDNTRRALHTSVIAHEQAVTGGVFVHLAELADTGANVYRSLLNHWIPDGK